MTDPFSPIIIAIALGIIEGLTEFIPVSSTGHLILLGNALEFSGPLAKTFEVFIQLGAILAVVVLYLQRFRRLFDFSGEQKGFNGRAGIGKLAVAGIPILLVGAVGHRYIKEVLFHPVPVAMALIVGGVAMLLVERYRAAMPTVTTVDEISYGRAFGVGVFQIFALWPGMSRSGSTIVGAMLLGCSRTAAAEFSFLVAVPVMCAAVTYEMYKSASLLTAADIPVFATGFITSFIVALGAIKFFLRLIQHVSLRPFAIYRIVLGIICLLVAYR